MPHISAAATSVAAYILLYPQSSSVSSCTPFFPVFLYFFVVAVGFLPILLQFVSLRTFIENQQTQKKRERENFLEVFVVRFS